ncbi:MAG: molybdopterin molybdotransferase [Methyloprofundus sp.]|nr:MAG: molybdopterin molybdotransferase [Methyloprofundus sp.]
MNTQKMKLADANLLADDVRMRGFKQRVPIDSVLNWLVQQSIKRPEQNIAISDAAGRVLAHDIVSDINIPGFARSMMDGYAILASDAQGTSSYNQLPLQVIGKSMPGQGTEVKVTSGTAVRIMTGAPVPEGANAVLPAENVELDDSFIMVMESVAEGRNIGRIGEDISTGATILKQGRRLRPQDIALLASLGNKEIAVFRQLQISIVVTGSEILPVGSRPQGYQITNSNGPMLAALSSRDGAVVVNSCIVTDDPELIEQSMLGDYDLLLITGGTSVGEEDLVPLLVAKLGELIFHGVAMRPSRSTGIGLIADKPIFLLPGNPVACLCAYDFFAGRLIRKLSGQQRNWPYVSVTKKLQQKLVSMLGRTDYARVRLYDNDTVAPIAIGGAAIISSTTEADGFVIVPANSEGYAAETEVEVFLYD